ncbi:MAG: flagellar hook assembly protein FlgD [Alphaproteobacteria bacterium]
MNVSATSGTATQSQSQSSALTSLSSNFDSFLTLLTQQLQNQDPLSPMDTNEFTNQLVQFSGVEQAIKTNTLLESLVVAEQANQTLTALDFIGREITAIGDEAVLQDGQATFAYTLDSDAASATYTIRDSNGAVVFSGTGPTDAGSHEIAWNGVGASGGAQPDGIYTISIEARDANGNQVGAEPGVVGVVSGVESRNGQTVVMIGDLAVYLQDITSVRAVSQQQQADDGETAQAA